MNQGKWRRVKDKRQKREKEMKLSVRTRRDKKINEGQKSYEGEWRR